MPIAKVTSETENVACTWATSAPKCSRTAGSAGMYRLVAIDPTATMTAQQEQQRAVVQPSMPPMQRYLSSV